MFALVLALSLALNGVLLYKLYRPEIREFSASFKKPPPVSTSDHVRGEPGARATVIEYADFQCPFCRRLYAELKTLQPQLKFRWVYRQFPLDIHPDAKSYSVLSECAADQHKFWQVADALNTAPPATSAWVALTAWASKLGLNSSKMAACLHSNSASDRVKQDLLDASSLLIEGTPTFFVNGRRYLGVLPKAQLKAAILHAESAS